ncbi:MAG: hypothetical protein HC850_15275 [Rhodomicrobium sp.]|nr:hypothetical protein [Rhodomicrobium sp.]
MGPFEGHAVSGGVDFGTFRDSVAAEARVLIHAGDGGRARRQNEDRGEHRYIEGSHTLLPFWMVRAHPAVAGGLRLACRESALADFESANIRQA